MIEALRSLRFDIPEILSLIGLAQCLYILVYVAFRAGSWRQVAVPFLYYFVLAAAFLITFTRNTLGPHLAFYTLVEWSLWTSMPPLGVLLMVQIIQIKAVPAGKNFWILGLVPAALIGGLCLDRVIGGCHAGWPGCAYSRDWLTLAGLLAGIVSLIAMASQRPHLLHLSAQAAGRERYWLVLSLVLVNLGLLATMLLSLTPLVDDQTISTVRTICGLGFVYLTGTSLFRIYPQAIRLIEKPAKDFSSQDHKIVEKIEALLNCEKVYQEATYNRVNLAQELGVSETVVSRIVNQHFHKTVPQLFNELKVDDAKRLLRETDAAIKTIAEEVGFNSIASFNRVFKEVAGVNPGQYREDAKIIAAGS